MKLFDSHAHIDDKSYNSDLDAVIDRARNENVTHIMVVGIDIATSLKAVKIARTYPNTITSVGIHPHDARHCTPDKIDTLMTIARENDCVKAWGETGLDFNRMFSPQEDQEACLKAQLAAADEMDLPLIFHERDSNGRFYDIIKADGPESRKGVIHCFSGTKDEMFKYLDLGYYIGITGILTIQKRGEYLRSIVSQIPEDRLLIETDAPYLTPAPQKNKVRRNEPAFVKSVLKRLAQVRNTDMEKLADQVFNNTLTLYGLEQ